MTDRLEPKPHHHYYVITGRLAEGAVRESIEPLAQEFGFHYTLGVMPITVAALITPRWLRRHLDVPHSATHVIVPGYCDTGLEELGQRLSIPVICGPKDCRDLASLFGRERLDEAIDAYDIEIIAEINHAPRFTVEAVVEHARKLHQQGADIIDFGCDPAKRCGNIGDYIAAIRDQGLTVSVDTFDVPEASVAVQHGATLVLSVNSSNRDAAADWGCEVVAIPDAPGDKKSFSETIDFLDAKSVPMRLDPILEPIGAGFAQSLVRYAEVRREYPDAPMMMGIGNLTELSDVDSAGVNLLLLGFCQELAIRSVLTTQVINWARTSVSECDIARRLTYYSATRKVPPKRISEQLVMLRDAKLRPHSKATLDALASSIRDNNYRIFAQDGQIHLMAADLHLQGDEPYALFEQLLNTEKSGNVDEGHAFYLGFELAKASIALLLGKQYEQDQALRWGHLTREEVHRRVRRNR